MKLKYNNAYFAPREYQYWLDMDKSGNFLHDLDFELWIDQIRQANLFVTPDGELCEIVDTEGRILLDNNW